MAAISWKSGISGTWTAAADWSAGAVPSTSSDVTIAVAPAAGSTAYTVTLASASRVDSVTLDQAAATLDVDNGTLTVGKAFAVEAGTLALNGSGEISGGTIKESGGTLVSQGGTLAGVTYDGTLEVGNFDSLVVTGGITLEGAAGTGTGTMAITGAGSGVVFAGSQTLNNASITMGSFAGSLPSDYDNYIAVGTYDEAAATTLTLGPKLSITQVGTSVEVLAGTAEDKAVNKVINEGTITAGYNGSAINSQFQVENLTNTGTILISHDDNFAGLSNNSGTVRDTGGSISLFGSISNYGLISIAGTASTLIDAGPYDLANSGKISINDGANISFGTSGGTISNTGTLLISDATARVGSTFSNAGTITLDRGTLTNGGTLAASALLNAADGAISGFGTISAAIVNDGRITAHGGTLTLSGALSGSGKLVVDAGDRLNLTAVARGEVAIFATGTASVLGLSPATFLGKIGGFAAGDTIDLAKTGAKAASFSGDSLVVTLSTGSTIALATTSALTGSLTVVAGTSGDTLIEFGGAASAAGLQDGPTIAVQQAEEEGGVMRPEMIGEHPWVIYGH